MVVLSARGRGISPSPVARKALVLLHGHSRRTRQPDVGLSQGRRHELAEGKQCSHTRSPRETIRSSPGSSPCCRQASAASLRSSPFPSLGASPSSFSVRFLGDALSLASFPTSSLVTLRPGLSGSLSGRLPSSYASPPPSFAIRRRLSCSFSLTYAFPRLLGSRLSPSRTLSSSSSAVSGRLADEVRRGGGGRSRQFSSSSCAPRSQDRTLPYSPEGPPMSFSSSSSSSRFQDLLHRLEEEERRKRRQEWNKGRSSDSCSFSSAVAGESIKGGEQGTSSPPSPNGQIPLTTAPASQRELLQHVSSCSGILA